jgi:hypothetical protein
MPAYPSTNSSETSEEALLRATFQEHAPADVALDTAWAAVARRLSAARAPERTPRLLRRLQRKVALPLAAAALALAVVLGAAGYAAAQDPFSLHDPGMLMITIGHLYQDIGQRQEADGVTITVTRAYADEGRTVIEYTLKLAPHLAQRYNSASLGSWLETEGHGLQTTGETGFLSCTGLPAGGGPESCVMVHGPYQPGAAIHHLDLTLEVSAVYLINREGTATQTGPWRFHFSLPYHRTNAGSIQQFLPRLIRS